MKITQELFAKNAFDCVGFLNVTSAGPDRVLTNDEADRGVVAGARALEVRLGLPAKSITTETLFDGAGDFAGGKWTYSGPNADEPVSYDFDLDFGSEGIDVQDDEAATGEEE